MVWTHIWFHKLVHDCVPESFFEIKKPQKKTADNKTR